jgi:tellurite resistance protein TehA-like permease
VQGSVFGEHLALTDKLQHSLVISSNFTPAWFTVNMGTGIVSSLAARFHFGAGSLALEVISLAFFFLNLVFFVFICGMTIARYYMYPEVCPSLLLILAPLAYDRVPMQMWLKMISHPAQSLFVGAFAMGAATLINSALTANQSWSFGGTGFLYALWGLWWLDLAVSFFTAFGMLYAMYVDFPSIFYLSF